MSIHCDFCDPICSTAIAPDGFAPDKVYISAPGDMIHICDECVALAMEACVAEKSKRKRPYQLLKGLGTTNGIEGGD